MKLSRSPEKTQETKKAPVSSVMAPHPSITQVTKEPDSTPQRESASLLMHGILDANMSPEWETPEPETAADDQSPAPGSLALDPALNDGFEGSSLEQITEEFLSVAQGTGKSDSRSNVHGTHDVVRWEDMATHPIFELEPSLTGVDTLDEKPRDRDSNPKKRGGDNGIQRDSSDAKRIRA